MTVRVLLVDDQAMVRAGFRMILETEDDVEVVGEAEDGGKAIVAAAQDGRPRVLILTTFERDEYIFEALRAGASGFLLKNAPPEDLIDALRVVAAGDALLAPSVTRRIIAEFARQPVAVPRTLDLSQLTEREVGVLRLLARGMSNAEIADALYVGEATVKTHVSNILTKLNLRDRVQAVVLAYESGLILPGST